MATDPNSIVQAPPADPNVQSSPFTQNTGNPFGEIAAVTDTQPNDNVPTPSRTATMALALLDKQNEQIRQDMGQALEGAMQQANEIISRGQEQSVRLQSVIDGTQDQLRGLQAQVGTEIPGTGQIFTPELVHQFQQTTAADRANNINDLSASSLEEAAVRNIHDLIASGDTVGAQVAINRLDPAKSSEYGAIKDFYTKDLIIANAIEKAGFDNDQESVLHKVLTGIASIPEELLLFKSNREKVGLVDEGTGGYKPGWFDYLFPGSTMQAEVRAWHNMSAPQQAAYLPKLLDHIKNNGSYFWVANDPGTTLRLLSDFQGDVSKASARTDDAMSLLNIALMGTMFKGVGSGLAHAPQLLTGLGARKAATNLVTNAWDEAITNGARSMTEKTAIVPDALLQESLPKSINPLHVPELPSVPAKTTKSSLMTGTAAVNTGFTPKPFEYVSHAGEIGDRVAYAQEVLKSPMFENMTSPSRWFNPEEKQVAINDTLDTIKARTNSNLLDSESHDIRLANGQTVTEVTATLNVPKATEDDALNWLRNNGYGADPSNVIQDTSGQFFPRVKQYVRETGFWTNDLNPPNQHFMARWFGTPFATSDFRVAAKGTASGQIQQQWLREIKGLNKSVTKLGPNDRAYLREVIQKGVNERRWLSPNELDTVWQRATGKLPNDNVKAAYWNFQTANDIDYVMRNANSLADLATRGVEKTRFDVMGKTYDDLGIVEHDLKPVNEDVLDTSTGVTYKPGELSETRMKELEGQGYYLVTTENLVDLKDGTKARKFLVKKGDIEINQLPEFVLPYDEGGHRIYSDKYFVKQGVEITQPNGSKILDKPGVFVTAGTKAEAARWANVMEDARLAVRDGADAAYLDQNIFRGQRGLPSGEDFLKGVQDGTWNTDHPFEALYDRELPTLYAKSGSKFADDAESGANGFYRTNGQLYYSKKGDALKNVNGDLAPTIDPFKMQNQALANVARLSSFDDFKTSSIHRWVNTYKQFLDHSANATPAEIFNNASPTRAVGTEMRHQILGQREAIKRILNFRGQFDLEKENALRRLHEWIIGDSDNAFRKALSKVPLHMIEKNPVMALRSAAFDMKLGLFNVGQFFIQTSTAFSALAMSPRMGMKGIFSIPAYLAWRIGGYSENVLDLLAKRGFDKLMGFGSEQEFKNYMRFLNKGGFLSFGDSHLLINTAHPAAAYAFMDKVSALRTAGRVFFNAAEDANRLVAARIAYDEAVKKFGIADLKNFEFNEFFRARAENYAFNMSSTSAAAWQKGLLSIPTQFWAYNWRMAEALYGRQFTRSQKIRLLLSQLFMAGAVGVPIYGSVAGWMMDYHNQVMGGAPRLTAHADDTRGPVTGFERAQAILQRGMVDELIRLTTGADVQAGQRLGTGDFFQQTAEKLMGISEYSDKVTPLDMAGGATYSIMGEALGSAFSLVQHWAAAETGGIPAQEMTRHDWEAMFRQISTVNNVMFRAWAANRYGIFESQKGNTLISDLPPADAAFIALGFAPGELRDRSAIAAWKKDQKQMILDSANFVNRLWVEAAREPDKFDENSRIVSQFVNMLPPDQRTEVMKQAHVSRDPSDYSKLLRIRQSMQSQDEAINAVTQASEDMNTDVNQIPEEVNQQ
jgi:hypothetical protein